MTNHMNGKHHTEMAEACSSRSVASFVNPQTQTQQCVKAESLWSKFVSKHNLPIQSSDHATKFLRRMFPDSQIANKFSCGNNETAAIVKEALAPHYLTKLFMM